MACHTLTWPFILPLENFLFIFIHVFKISGPPSEPRADGWCVLTVFYFSYLKAKHECDLIYHIWWAMYRWSEHLYRNILESSSSRFTALCFQACLLVEKLLDFRQRLVLGFRQATVWGSLKNCIIFLPYNLCVICRRDIFPNQMTKRAADRRDAAWHIKRRG